jgi:sec-independent protein translocase protein TatB
MFSVPHLVILFIVVLVVFGPQKLPELARNLGKMMAEFRKASTDFRMAFEEEMRNIERQARETELKKVQDAAAAQAATRVTPAPADGERILPPPAENEPIEPVVSPVAESVARGADASDGMTVTKGTATESANAPEPPAPESASDTPASLGTHPENDQQQSA